MRRTLVALVALALLSPHALAQKQVVNLRPKWEKGQEIRYRMEQTSTGATTMPNLGALDGDDDAPAPQTKPNTKTKPAPTPTGKNKNTKPTTTEDDANAQTTVQAVDFRLKVIDSDPEGGAVVHLIYDRLKATVTSALGKSEFDSTSPPDKDAGNPLASIMRPMIGATIVLTLDRDGNITEVEGGENLIPGGLGAPSPAGALNPADLKKTWGPLFTTRRSGGQAAVGDTWTTTTSTDASLIGSFLMNTQNTLKSHSAGTANIDFKGTMTPGPESAGTAAPVQIKDAKTDGTCLWDTQRGQLRELNMTQAVTIEANLAGSKVTSKQDSKTTIKRMN